MSIIVLIMYFSPSSSGQCDIFFPSTKYDQHFCLPDLRWDDKMCIGIHDTATNIILYAGSLSEFWAHFNL